ncbi:hypothetical protein [Pseudohoeflea coraliihabitans]|uniref:Uncharacterized protein n=1 Tax=Pseudohoeflea coraliihabitans TaxID=2860393 RepID=A0ABS6WTF4_9HYPH|nr:hypothetical protein [Pseudohoeflea sp. DP4N28-3]MBW3099246.1 hypothetical protein [Pseudohoeflea sp. DP4N28-3]
MVTSLNAARALRDNDNSHMTPADALRFALEGIESEDIKCNKMLVLSLNTERCPDSYDTGWIAANLSGSEIIALLEIVKIRLSELMLGE